MLSTITAKINNILNAEDKKRLLENFFSLSVLQGANYILPLITLPYLVRVLGPEKYGLIAFAQAFIQYFNILTDYGFNLSATREISIHRENKEKIAEIFSSVMIIKFTLLILSFIIMTIIVFSFEKFRKDWLVYYLTFGMVIGQVLFPVWFFQGMERMKYITVIEVFIKILFVGLIFLFVKENSDYWKVPLIQSISSFIGGIISLIILYKFYKLKFFFLSSNTLKYYFQKSTHIFLSNSCVTFFNEIVTLIGGIFFNYTILGYYKIAEKIFIAFRNLFSIVFRIFFPYFSKKGYISKNYTVFVIIISIFLTILSLSSAKFILNIFSLDNYNIALNILYILSLSLFLCGINIMLFTLYFLSKGKNKEFLKITFYAGIFNIIFLLIGIKYCHSIYVLPLSIFVTEILLTILYISNIYNEKNEL